MFINLIQYPAFALVLLSGVCIVYNTSETETIIKRSSFGQISKNEFGIWYISSRNNPCNISYYRGIVNTDQSCIYDAHVG